MRRCYFACFRQLLLYAILAELKEKTEAWSKIRSVCMTKEKLFMRFIPSSFMATQSLEGFGRNNAEIFGETINYIRSGRSSPLGHCYHAE